MILNQFEFIIQMYIVGGNGIFKNKNINNHKCI